jgi:hypothetical protein
MNTAAESDAIHSFMRAADSATKRRPPISTDQPPQVAGRAHLRVETLISPSLSINESVP